MSRSTGIPKDIRGKLTNKKDLVKYSMSSRGVSTSRAVVGRSLLVSNDSGIVRKLTASLEQFAITADVCPDLVTAVTLLNTRKFEAVFVDLALGEHSASILEWVRLSQSNQNSVTFALVNAVEEQYLHNLPNFIMRKPLCEHEIGNIMKAALGLVIRDYRRYFRCPLNAPVSIRIPGKLQVSGEMMNISEGGMAAATSVAFCPGALIKVEFALPGESTKFALEAEVCWSDEKGRVGFQFRSVPPDQNLLLQAWLSRKIEEGIPEPIARLFQKDTGNSDIPQSQ